MKKPEYVSVMLPQPTVEHVKELVEKSDGLFEDESDFIHHCIIYHNRDYVRKN